jgi:hypothetical protein
MNGTYQPTNLRNVPESPFGLCTTTTDLNC